MFSNYFRIFFKFVSETIISYYEENNAYSILHIMLKP